MKTLAALGLLAGGFLFVPKGVLGVATAIWIVSKVSPLISVVLLAGALVIGGAR